MTRSFVAGILALGLGCALRHSYPAVPEGVQDGFPRPGARVETLDGLRVSFVPRDSATAVFYVDPTCPGSRLNVPRYRESLAAHRDVGAAVRVVIVGREPAARQYARLLGVAEPTIVLPPARGSARGRPARLFLYDRQGSPVEQRDPLVPDAARGTERPPGTR